MKAARQVSRRLKLKNSCAKPSAWLCLFVFVCSLSLPLLGQAQDRKVGLGVIIGQPIGISGNYRLGFSNSVDAALSYDGNLYLHSTYLFHIPYAFYFQGQEIDWYYGVGARLATRGRESETHFGPRGSLGLSWPLQNRQMELFGEASLVMDLAPRTLAEVGAAIGGRFYF